VWSFLPTMYQVGFDLQAVPSIFWLNRSTVGTPWVAQTTFCSCSERSPAKSHGAATMLGIPRQTLESRIRALRINKHQFKSF